MDSQQDVQRMLRLYRERYPQEGEGMERFLRFAGSFAGSELYNRKNPTGHITAGGLVVSRATGRVLLLKHRQLGRWLQPGGHVEAADGSVLDAACREIAEETGIGRDRLELLPVDGQPGEAPVPADVDSHRIPACPGKGEGEHYHHDMRFVFLYDGAEETVRTDPTESDGFRWVTLDELGAMPDFRRIAPKIRYALRRQGIVA